MTEKTMDEVEARQILEDLARNGPPTAQVASIKVLRDMDKAAKAEEEAERESRFFDERWAELYEVSDEVSEKRRQRKAGAA